MPRTDRSIAILTGMIIAGLYVILLVAFSRESYMRRDAASRADASGGFSVMQDVSKRVCRIEPPLCAALFADADERRSCVTSLEAMRRLVSEPAVVPLTLEGLRRAMRDAP
jgi:hypothetical protein